MGLLLALGQLQSLAPGGPRGELFWDGKESMGRTVLGMGRSEVGLDRGGTGGGLHPHFLSSMSGSVAPHEGAQACVGKIAGTNLRRPIAGPTPLPGDKHWMR